MRKTFGKLFIIFGVLLCIFALYGCAEVAETTVQSSEITTAEATETTLETSETTAEEKETESTAEETISKTEETSAEITETEEKTVETSETEETNVVTESTTAELVETTEIIVEETTEETTYNDETLEGLFVPDENLIEELIDYLEDIGSTSSDPDTVFKMTDQIDQINRGAQPLQIEFDPDRYYYACAYYTPEHLEEEDFYCCASEYTWVGFNDEENIVEYYNDTKLLVVIQINKTKLCLDILYDDRSVPEVEYFQIYSPIFVDGVNTAKSIIFDDKMIYLNTTDTSTVYIYSKRIIHDFSAMYYVKLDSRNYIVYDHTEHVENVANKEEFKNVFGNHYDQLIEIMITDKYFVENSKGEKIYYGIFEIEEFFNAITK